MSSVRISSLQRRRLCLDFASFPIIGFLPGRSPHQWLASPFPPARLVLVRGDVLGAGLSVFRVHRSPCRLGLRDPTDV